MFNRFWFAALIGIYTGVLFYEFGILKLIIAALIICTVVFFICKEKEAKRFLKLLFCFIFVGAFIISIDSGREIISSDESNVSGTVTELDLDKGSAIINTVNGKVICYVKGEVNFEEGDNISFESKISSFGGRRNPGGIDYRKLYLSKNIKGYAYINSPKLKKIPEYNKFYCARRIVREYIIKILEENMNRKYMGYSVALILGCKDYISEDSYETVKAMGLASVMAVSGLHVAIFYFIAENILKFFKISFYMRRMAEAIFLTVFALVSFSFYSVIRAVHLIFSVILGGLFNRKTDAIETTSIFSVFMIVCNPYIIYNVSFLLSNMAVIGIFYFSNGRNKLEMEKNYFYEAFRICIFINIMIAPVLLYYFGEISLIGILIYPIISCFLEFLIVVNMISVMIFSLTGIAFQFLVSNMLFSVFQMALDLGVRFGVSAVSFNLSNPFMIFLYYFFVLLFPLCDRVHLKRLILFVLAGILTIISCNFYIKNFRTAVYIFDVGMGDGILIKSCGKNIMVDCGPEKNYENIIRSLKYLNVKDIDYFLITHFHEDHFGAMAKISENVDIKNIISRNTFSEDFEISWGNNKSLKLFFPEKIDINENNNSIGAIFSANGCNLILTGDMEMDREKEFMEDADKYFNGINILKVSHHGSKTASSYDFIIRINPVLSVVSYGKNSYGLPDKEVINKFEDLNYKVIETEKSGCVKIDMNEKEIRIKTYIP